jgi:GAF domain-containing protein
MDTYLSTPPCPPPGQTAELEALLDALMAQHHADFGCIQLLDRATGKLHICVHRGFSDEFVERFREVDVFHASYTARALRSGRPAGVYDIQADPSYPLARDAAEEGYRGLQATPMIDEAGEVVGVISTHFRIPRRLGRADREAAQLCAELAAKYAAAWRFDRKN